MYKGRKNVRQQAIVIDKTTPWLCCKKLHHKDTSTQGFRKPEGHNEIPLILDPIAQNQEESGRICNSGK